MMEPDIEKIPGLADIEATLIYGGNPLPQPDPRACESVVIVVHLGGCFHYYDRDE